MPYRILTDMTLELPRDLVFAFFSDAENLESITPPELRFEIRTPKPIAMKTGTHIEYRLRLYGLPFHWRTCITAWEPESRFVDEQESGPFALWIHEHRFESIGPGATRIRDEVRYALPLEPLGRIAHPLVRAKLDRIFAYREERVRALLAP
ncbi:SRPBCC family protein [Myxococcota bacterium]|nr:SRPBCC family protein [Myxococcota bacterium]